MMERTCVGVLGSMAATMVLGLATGQATAQTAIDTTRVGSVDSVFEAEFASASKRFSRLSSRRRDAVIDSVRAAMLAVDDPYVRAVRDLAGADDNDDPRVDLPRERRVGASSETAVDESRPLAMRLPFPATVGYRFGVGTVEELEVRGARGQRLSRAKRAAALQEQQLDAMLDGRLPELDAALAALLARLDDQRAMDLQAAFLDSWKNGAETFYDALDRTAGRMEGVFHYDAMLEEWSRYCVPRDHADREVFRRGLDQQIRGFQDAFLSYRSYRSVREMLALSLLLEPDDRLPEPLDRYEVNGGDGTHSTRECVEVVLAVNGRDPLAVVNAFLEHAEPVEGQPWESRHEAWRGIDRMFEAMRDRAAASGLDTFELARGAKEQRRVLRTHLARVARIAFVDALRG